VSQHATVNENRSAAAGLNGNISQFEISEQMRRVAMGSPPSIGPGINPLFFVPPQGNNISSQALALGQSTQAAAAVNQLMMAGLLSQSNVQLAILLQQQLQRQQQLQQQQQRQQQHNLGWPGMGMPQQFMVQPSYITSQPDQTIFQPPPITSAQLPSFLSHLLTTGSGPQFAAERAAPNHASRQQDDTANTDGRSTERTTPTLTNRPPVCLYIDLDESVLSEYQCLLRKQIELFETLPEDANGGVQGRNRPILVGQV
jgi:hypothetical protein